MSASRVGRKPVAIPKGVEVLINGQELAIKGPKGQIQFSVHPDIQVVMEEGVLKVQDNVNRGYLRKGSGSRMRNAINGTVRSNLANAVAGVTHTFERKLQLVGVGYKAAAKGQTLSLSLGFSHPVEFPVPAGVTVTTPTPTEIIVVAFDKRLGGLVCSKIRAYRQPEPYKGKGIRYADEIIERKETKKK